MPIFSDFYRPFIAAFLILFCSGCSSVYETGSDVQARQALDDLIQIQEDYHKKNQRFARSLTEINEAGYKLNYHTGIVYLEIESADKDKWRAVALAAESTTARVFAFDTNKAGAYEMDEEEVSSYVLGSLNFIREQQWERSVRDVLNCSLIGVLTLFGLRTWKRNPVPGSGWMIGSFLVCIPSLVICVITVNHMDKDIVFSKTLQALLALGMLSVLMGIAGTVKAFRTISKGENLVHLSSLAICTVLMALFTTLVTTHTFLNYSENPDPLEKYLKLNLSSQGAGSGAR